MVPEQIANTPVEDAQNVVFMEKLTSCEFFLKDKGAPQLVLYDIGLSFERGQVWGITGNNLFEIKLLAEIMANIKPYRAGKCVLLERGMMRHKRIILPHVFYIGSTEMVYNNMNVLEFLMFATAKFPGEKVDHQEQLFEYLISIGLKRISLSPIYMLSKEQKAVIIMLVAAYSDSQLIVHNLPDYYYNDTLIPAIQQIAQLIAEKGKTLVITTRTSDLIEKACSHILFLLNGTVHYQGDVLHFCHKYDKNILTIQDNNAGEIAKVLRETLPGYQYDLEAGNLIVRSCQDEEENPNLIYERIIESGFAPAKIQINKKNVKNAREQIIKHYDL
ncbi:MAG: hypothetical protein ACOX0E_09425 [Syntrophomonadaceae bacterium]|jgi:ABC-2 type transport system ATP-binding protein